MGQLKKNPVYAVLQIWWNCDDNMMIYIYERNGKLNSRSSICVSVCVYVTKVDWWLWRVSTWAVYAEMSWHHHHAAKYYLYSYLVSKHLCNIKSSAVRARDVSIPQSVDLFQVLSGQTNQHHTSTSVIIELRLLFVCLRRGQGKKCPKVDPKMR